VPLRSDLLLFSPCRSSWREAPKRGSKDNMTQLLM
jgi:hypothetical protein